MINLQEEQAAACFRHRVLIPWCSLPGVTLSMNSPWQMPKTNLVPLWRTPLYVTIKVVSLMPCSCWRSCKALWLSQTGFSTFFLPPWCFPLLSLYYCFLFLSVNAEECYPVLWNRLLPPITEKLHFVIDLTGLSAALNGRGWMEESQPRVHALPLCSW